MKLGDLTTTSNYYTDEQFNTEYTIRYANMGLSIVNANVNTNFPRIEKFDEDYTALPDKWFEGLIGNYISYSIKLNDGSLKEAQEYKNLFYELLADFRTWLTGNADKIDDEYKDVGFGDIYEVDIYQTPALGFDNFNRGSF